MWRLIIFLLFLIASVYLGLEAVHHQGYILILFHPWIVQIPIWFALLSLFVVFGFFYFIIVSMDKLQLSWYRIKNWLRFRREHRSYSKTQHGLTLLIEGRWAKAEKLLSTSISQSIEPLLNYLGSALAAYEQGANERSDDYIKKAYQIAPHAELAIGLTQAELEFKQGQLEHAVATLNHLRQLSKRHPRVLKLLEKVYVRLADWQNLLALLPVMRKAKVKSREQEKQFEKHIYTELLNEATDKDKLTVQAIWQQLPRSLRKNPDVIYAYVKQLLRLNETKEIEALIRTALKEGYHGELVSIYGELPFTQLNRQLVIVGAWLKLYGPQPAILLTLGQLCVRVQLWGKAKDYFEKCLSDGPNAQASLAYGQLLEYLDEEAKAKEQYRIGLTQLAREAKNS